MNAITNNSVTIPRVIKYESHQDYLNRRPITSSSTMPATEQATKVPSATSDKADISERAQELAKDIATMPPGAVAAAKNVGSAAATVVDGATKSVAVPLKSEGVKEQALPKKASSAQAQEKAPPMVNRPGIFFISGWQFGKLSSSDAGGLKEMSKYINGAEHFSWTEKSKIMEEIKKRPTERPIIMVGHSLGGDLAVEIANELNNMENGFRKVNLLVTLDSVGLNNDIIPQNVEKNLNFIGDKDFLYNDGPNIARDIEFTNVINELRQEGHTDLDDSPDIQFKIYKTIGEVVASSTSKIFDNEKMA
ncbi:MAG: hypothetical protein A2504_03635 [Bdellovibrionales bacterium RIFOXYD12_FULL_39_22]|nr:MAG: hypothetical protein A2385_11385 [Bdellovibrionales bacterium RIFOXYB1_FULL_39_21]OFZ41669.1 MAG: hypothetical protein A2485_01695 [Bdellovibrionales bacterium RIFOXYC12_FULL_39_17]OFZ46069.1 MAG: hypothetical protein A2404_12060 [Bdellovibrionales bacterium RIFOXYC1_FULL_39_130]OFZ74896.1 MAG: hypothetical protein A2560_15100 [Bdellovibrionales bacterium RIFOXYD1_FULL_39_84]OFZ92749.1 MAG: hypothetical protein A2504_03635 [Bdellovibrionales bacterium RIFOXYD12_FULL_39_22]HLE12533.1 hy